MWSLVRAAVYRGTTTLCIWGPFPISISRSTPENVPMLWGAGTWNMKDHAYEKTTYVDISRYHLTIYLYMMSVFEIDSVLTSYCLTEFRIVHQYYKLRVHPAYFVHILAAGCTDLSTCVPSVWMLFLHISMHLYKEEQMHKLVHTGLEFFFFLGWPHVCPL